MVEGLNEAKREEIAQEFVGGTVHLLDSANAVADGDTSISSNASASTDDGQWTVTHDNSNGTTTLENSEDINMGEPSGFTIDQIVIESSVDSSDFIIDDSPSGDTDLSGDGSTSLPAGDVSYTFGGE